jgi:hypothetical protein
VLRELPVRECERIELPLLKKLRPTTVLAYNRRVFLMRPKLAQGLEGLVKLLRTGYRAKRQADQDLFGLPSLMRRRSSGRGRFDAELRGADGRAHAGSTSFLTFVLTLAVFGLANRLQMDNLSLS